MDANRYHVNESTDMDDEFWNFKCLFKYRISSNKRLRCHEGGPPVNKRPPPWP